MTRREFLGGLAAASAAPVLAVQGGEGAGTHDLNLAVFLSDIHCNGRTKGWVQHQHPILRRYVSEILRMRPLPANVVVFGDFSASKGWAEDFRLAREILQPLMDAGIRFTCGMGNHGDVGYALVVYSHDIAPEPSKIGMRTEWLEKILATAEENGVPVRGFGEI